MSEPLDLPALERALDRLEKREREATPGHYRVGEVLPSGEIFNVNIVYSYFDARLHQSVVQVFALPRNCSIAKVHGDPEWAEGLNTALTLCDARNLYPHHLRLVRQMIEAVRGCSGNHEDRIGIRVTCSVCGYTKKPRGRSAAIGMYYCDRDCPGYGQEPHVGDLWPRETAREFGYAVSEFGSERTQTPCDKCSWYWDVLAEHAPAILRAAGGEE